MMARKLEAGLVICSWKDYDYTVDLYKEILRHHVTKNGDYLVDWGVYLGTKFYEVFDNKQRGGNSLTFDVDL